MSYDKLSYAICLLRVIWYVVLTTVDLEYQILLMIVVHARLDVTHKKQEQPHVATDSILVTLAKVIAILMKIVK